MRQRVCDGDDVSSLKSRVKEFMKMLVEAFGEHCDSGLYTLKYHLLYHKVDYIRQNRTLSDSESISYEYFIVLIKKAYKRTSQKKDR